MRTLSLLTCLAISSPCLAQTVYAPTITPVSQRILALTESPKNQPVSLEYTLRGYAHNNIMDLGDASTRHSGPTQFTGSSPRVMDSVEEGGAMVWGSWRVAYISSRADRYDGNANAADIYLRSRKGPVAVDWQGDAFATMNRSDMDRLTVTNQFPIQTRLGRGRAGVTFTAVQLNRAQLGKINTTAQSGNMTGTLNLLTTRGMPSSYTRSLGASIDAQVVTPVAPNVTTGIWTENLLSYLPIRHMMQIDADLATGEVKTDPDGFVYSAAVASGTYNERANVRAQLERHIFAGASYRERANDWVLLAANDQGWRVNGGVSRSLGTRARYWALVGVAPFDLTLGIAGGQISFDARLDNLDFGRSRSATLGLTWRMPLSR